ncbi:hypothetical protein AB0E69_10800 [Kribbella sp. NPDC026611]|uniref:hypothetical protein n=1 Tax=Kribbella sp. NPDC026611 TaxID=3154911 RepID=UPI0033C03828
MTRPLTNAEENPHAGKGSSVLLDIGDGVGAIVLTLPAALEDAEIERRPADGSPPPHHHHDGASHAHYPHVAVVPRPSPVGETVYSAVFFDVPEGRYHLHLLPEGPVHLTINVHSGQVTEATW